MLGNSWSIGKAARKFKVKPRGIRDWLNLNQALKKHGPVAKTGCKGWFGLPH